MKSRKTRRTTTNEEISGGDAVEWLVPWILRARELVKAGQPSACPDPDCHDADCDGEGHEA
jgi:hypothetical protein